MPTALIPTPVPGVGHLLQNNPGPMSLEGTQTYFLPGRTGWIVVDPGDDDAAHQSAIAAAGPVETIVVTHRHHDHVGGLARLRAATGAPSRGLAAEFSVGAPPLVDGEVIDLGSPLASVQVLATPGHTSDSVSLVLSSADAPMGVLTGDTLLGHGTTVIDHPDGRLGDYLDSLKRLAALGAVETLPAHGGFPGPVDALASQYLQHRLDRLDQVRDVVARLRTEGRPADVGPVTDIVYAHVDPSVRHGAEITIAAQLALLSEPGTVAP
jgi:glyoxylase-like metal-dependent hydrolase (beta-lactamase superfamily II)